MQCPKDWHWETINTPTADFVLPEGLTTADVLKHLVYRELGLGYYVPGVDFEETLTRLRNEPSWKAYWRKFLVGSASDGAETAAGFSSPLSLATAGAGALAKVPGAIGKGAKGLMGLLGAGFAGKGAHDVYDAGLENTGDAWRQRTTGLLGLISGAAGANQAIKGTPLANKLARSGEQVYQSALKPKDPKSVATGLREGVEVSKKGLARVEDELMKLRTQIREAIDRGIQQGATVNADKVTSRLRGPLRRRAMEADPEADIAAIRNVENEFLWNHESAIPVAKAQRMKVATSKQAGGNNAISEARRGIVRGLEEELVAQFPELKRLYKGERDFVGLRKDLESRVHEIGNRDLPSLGDAGFAGTGVGVVGDWLGGREIGVASGVGTALMQQVLRSPAAQSRLALALHRAGKIPYQDAVARVAAYQSALANAIGENATQKPKRKQTDG